MAYLLLLYDSLLALVNLAERSRQRLNKVYRTIRCRNVLATQVSALAGVDSSQESAVRNVGSGSPDHAFTSDAPVEDYQQHRIRCIDVSKICIVGSLWREQVHDSEIMENYESHPGDDWQLGDMDDGWTKSIHSLETFEYAKYGINVPF